jgi:hypothetical protein
MKKTPPVKITQKLGNVDRVISFRIEGVVADFLISKGIDPKLSAREYLRELAKDEGLARPETTTPEQGQ